MGIVVIFGGHGACHWGSGGGRGGRLATVIPFTGDFCSIRPLPPHLNPNQHKLTLLGLLVSASTQPPHGR